MLIVSIAGYADDSASLIGSRIQINGRAFVAVSLLGIGGLGSVYMIESEALPKIQKAMKVYDYDKKIKSGARRIRGLALKGYQRIANIDPTGSHFKFAPQLVKIDLNPHRTILPGEQRALSYHPTADMVIVLPVGGPDLRNRVLSMGIQSVSERILLAQKVLEDVLPELAFAAKNGLVLGDIGPQNILSNLEGKWGFNDFDSVVNAGEFNTVATPFYLAPELRNGKQSEWISDIYSLGLTVLSTFFSPADIRDIIGLSESKLPFGPSSNPERVFEKLDRMFQQLENPSPAAVVAFQNVRAFLHASLEPDPIFRRSELLILEMASGFRFEDAHLRKSEIGQLKSLLESKILPNDTSDSIAKKLSGFNNLDQLIVQLASSDSVYPQAFRVAQAMNVNIENATGILISKLHSRLLDEDQVAILDSYVASLGRVDYKLASMLVEKFILSGMYELTTIENIFNVLKTNPDLVKKFNDQLVQRLQSTTSSGEKLKIAMLYLLDPNPPGDVILTWLEAIADPKFADPKLAKSYNDQIEPVLLKLPFIGRKVVDNFLATISPIHSDLAIARLKLINRFFQRFISKTNPFLIDLIKPSDAGLTAKRSVIRLLAANCLRAAGNNSEDIQSVYMSAGIDDVNTENLPNSIFLSEANQIELINEHLVKGFNSLQALGILERVSNWSGRSMVLIKQALDNPNIEVRYRAARLITSNAMAFPADKITALPFLIEAIGNEKVDQNELRLLLKEPLSAGLLSKDAKSILTIRRHQFPDFFSKLGVRIDIKGFDATFAVLEIMGHKWDGLGVGRIFVDHLMSILRNPKSGLISEVYKQFAETPNSFLDKKKFEELLSTTSSDNVRFYTALLLHKKWKIWNSQIEKALIPFFESDLVLDHPFSIEALEPILDLLENGIEKLPFQKRNQILKMLSVAPLDLATIDRLLKIANASKYETEIGFILGRNEFSRKNNEVNLFLNSRASNSEIARFSKFLESKDLMVRFAAARNLSLLKHQSDLAISILIEGMVSQYSDLRQDAISEFRKNSFQINRNEMGALMRDYLNPLSKSRLLSREVLGLQQSLPSDIKTRLEKLYPGYSYQEILGVHRFRTPKPRSACGKFYQSN